METNKHLVDKIMISVSSVGESDFIYQAFLFRHSGKYADVQAFDKEVKGLPKVPIVDAVISYDCTSSGETHLLVVINALCVPTMYINLILTFVLIEAGLILNDTPKIQCKDPSVQDN